jgi:hypothetical protein
MSTAGVPESVGSGIADEEAGFSGVRVSFVFIAFLRLIAKIYSNSGSRSIAWDYSGEICPQQLVHGTRSLIKNGFLQ